jgi:hypothetical protein
MRRATRLAVLISVAVCIVFYLTRSNDFAGPGDAGRADATAGIRLNDFAGPVDAGGAPAPAAGPAEPEHAALSADAAIPPDDMKYVEAGASREAPTVVAAKTPPSKASVLQDALFYGALSGGPKTNEAMLRGSLRVTAERGRVLAAANISEQRATCTRGASGPVVLCGIARNRAKLAVEWAQWHRVLGVAKMHVYDDESADGLDKVMAPFVEAGVVVMHDTKGWQALESGAAERRAAYRAKVERHCAFAARREAGAGWSLVLDVAQFVVPSDGGCLDSLPSRRHPVLPVFSIGHGTQVHDSSRTPLEATTFAAGQPHTLSAAVRFHRVTNDVVDVLGRPPVDPKVAPFGADKQGNLVGARVLHYVAPSYAAVLRDELADRGRLPAVGEHVFDAIRAFERWSTQADRGFGRFGDATLQHVQANHRTLLVWLGFAATGRRARAKSLDLGGTHAVDALVARKALKRVREGRASNAALLDGDIIANPEPLLVNLTRAHVDLIGAAPCLRRGRRKLDITFCTYVRNRVKLTVEWVQWHRILGVAKFHIYDDDSSDGLRAALEPFIDAGVVVYHAAAVPPYFFRGNHVKGGLLASYGDCLDAEQRAAEQSGRNLPWVGLIDSDEFIALSDDECLADVVATNVAADPTKIGAVAIPWAEVGHNGEMHDDAPTQLQRTKFAKGMPDPQQRVKVIVRPDLAVAMQTAHKVDLRPPYRTTFHGGGVVRGAGWHTQPTAEVLTKTRLLHYHARSLASWMQRQLDGFSDDDNKVWDFDADVAESRWGGVLKRGMNEQWADDSRVRKNHALLLRGMGFPDAETPSV